MAEITVTDKTSLIRLGHVGENLANHVMFDISDWIDDYGEGVATVLHKRYGETEPYSTVCVQEDNKVMWPITSTDTKTAGRGKCELHFTTASGVVAKTKSISTLVLSSILASGESAESSCSEATDDDISELLDEVFEE